MATNGDSARKWLEENKHQVTETRVLQIRNNLEKKINELPESDVDGLSEEHQGLLEALDVLEAFLQEQSSARTATNEVTGITGIDASPLISEPSEPVPQLDDTEKKHRFQQLLKTGKV
ncbi:MAG: hypothetical protein ACPG5T_02080 [Endozoicomonas sp.]